ADRDPPVPFGHGRSRTERCAWRRRRANRSAAAIATASLRAADQLRRAARDRYRRGRAARHGVSLTGEWRAPTSPAPCPGRPPRTAAGAIAAGAAGMNLEDSRAGRLLPLEEQLEIIRAVGAAAPGLVLNARVDVFLEGGGDVGEAIERGNAYLAAGADCVYPIAAPFDAVGPLAAGIDGPVNVLVAPHDPPLAEPERLGVARVTFGSGLARIAPDGAARLAATAPPAAR